MVSSNPEIPDAPLPGPLKKPGAEYALFAVQIAFLAWTRLTQPTIYVDDAYIHFRNALHLSQGLGLVYNPGEWVIGTTSPVYAGILGMLRVILPIDLPVLALWFNFLTDVGIVILSLAWLRHAGLPLLFRHATVFVCSAEVWRMFFSSGGMEMSLLILALLGVFTCLHYQRCVAAGLILGIVIWIRPEGAIIGVLAFLALISERQWKNGSRMLIAFGFTFFVSIALLYFVYGSVIPLSVMVKTKAPWFTETVGYTGLDFFVQLGCLFPLNGLTGYYPKRSSEAPLLIANLYSFATLALSLAGVAWLSRHRQGLLALGLGGFLAGYYLFFALANPPLFFWYYVPFLWAALMLQGTGLWAMTLIASRWFRNPRWLNPIAVILWLSLSVLTASNNAIHCNYRGANPWQGLAFRHQGYDQVTREARYLKAANIINGWVGNDVSVEVGCTEIGIFGYYFRGRIFDACGLVTPETLRVLDPTVQQNLPPDSRGYPLNVFLPARPDLIMGTSEHALQPTATFSEIYEPVPDIPSGLEVFVRKDRKDLLNHEKN